MKKVFMAAGMFLLSAGAFAQTNLQMFYDFGKDRKHITTTLEMFKADDWGDTFFFVDYDYTTKDMRDASDYRGATGTYAEIARNLNFWKDSNLGALSAHVEWNGGVGIPQNWLFGAAYFMHSADFANTLTIEAMFKTF